MHLSLSSVRPRAGPGARRSFPEWSALQVYPRTGVYPQGPDAGADLARRCTAIIPMACYVTYHLGRSPECVSCEQWHGEGANGGSQRNLRRKSRRGKERQHCSRDFESKRVDCDAEVDPSFAHGEQSGEGQERDTPRRAGTLGERARLPPRTW